MKKPGRAELIVVVVCAWPLLCGGSCGDDDAPPGGECALADAVPVTHSGDISADETWPTGVHVVPSTITVRAGALLTIAGCTEVRLGANASLIADDEARGIAAEGTAGEPVRFVRDADAAAWGALVTSAPATLSLAHATLEGGGTDGAPETAEYVGASLVALAPGEAGGDVLRVVDVTVTGSAGVGVVLVGAGFDAASSALVVTGSGAQPVYLGADRATNLPTGTYTGNAHDEILLQQVNVAGYANNRPLVADATLRDRGVPYRVGAEGAGGASIVVGDSRETSPAAALTIEPGVTLRFSPQTGGGLSQILVNAHLVDGNWEPQGALIADGTADRPIVLTSAATAPAAGDWQGLYFTYRVDERSSVSNAVIEYAGGESTSTGVCESSAGSGSPDADGAVILFLESDGAPARAFVSSTRIAHSAGCGFYRNWQVTDVDFVSGNTFEDVAGCLQTLLPNALNVCPDSDCPML